MPTEEELEQRINEHIDGDFTEEEKQLIKKMEQRKGGGSK